MASSPSVHIRNLTHAFGSNRVLDDFNLEIRAPEDGTPGSTVCLIGPNGAGKSTLFNLLTGILRPSPAAAMEIAGRPVSTLSTSDIALLGVFRSVQGAGDIEPGLSVRSNLLLVPSVGSISWWARVAKRRTWKNHRIQLKLRMERTLTELGCAELIPRLDRKANELSYGWKLVVSAVRADISDAKLILLDEPFAGLDPVKINAVKRLLLKWRAESRNVLFVEHIRSAAMRALIEEVADRMILLDQGRAILDASPREVLADPRFVRAYTGSIENEGDPSTRPTEFSTGPYSPPAICFSAVTAQYDGITALRGFSLTVSQGQYVLLVGPNGAGKSTILRSVFGLGVGTAGRITLGITELMGLKPYQVALRGVGFVPQRERVFPNLTIGRNLAISAAQLPRAERQKAIERLNASLPFLRDRQAQLAGTLSGGEQAELALVMALMCNPRVLLVDELSIGLDGARSRELFSLIQRHTIRGLAILAAEQVYQVAMQNCDLVVALRDGAIVWQGPPGRFDSDRQASLFSGLELLR